MLLCGFLTPWKLWREKHSNSEKVIYREKLHHIWSKIATSSLVWGAVSWTGNISPYSIPCLIQFRANFQSVGDCNISTASAVPRYPYPKNFGKALWRIFTTRFPIWGVWLQWQPGTDKIIAVLLFPSLRTWCTIEHFFHWRFPRYQSPTFEKKPAFLISYWIWNQNPWWNPWSLSTGMSNCVGNFVGRFCFLLHLLKSLCRGRWIFWLLLSSVKVWHLFRKVILRFHWREKHRFLVVKFHSIDWLQVVDRKKCWFTWWWPSWSLSVNDSSSLKTRLLLVWIAH